MFFECFMVFLALFDIYQQSTGFFFSREPYFQEFLLKKPQNMFSWCFLSVSWYFKHYSTSEPRTGFYSQESDFQKVLKMPQSVLSCVFWVFQSIFSIVRHLCREPDFWAENRIFKNFFESIKICLVCVFWVFQSIFFSILWHLGREPDFWAEIRIFKKLLKSLKTCLVGVFWVLQDIFSIVRHLELRIRFFSLKPNFQKFLKKPQNMFSWCFCFKVFYYSTGIQIISCTLSDDSVLSESTGLFNPVLCVSQWNLFWQKNQPMRLCISNQVWPGREWFSSPPGDFNRLFEGLLENNHKYDIYCFEWHQSGP